MVTFRTYKCQIVGYHRESNCALRYFVAGGGRRECEIVKRRKDKKRNQSLGRMLVPISPHPIQIQKGAQRELLTEALFDFSKSLKKRGTS